MADRDGFGEQADARPPLHLSGLGVRRGGAVEGSLRRSGAAAATTAAPSAVAATTATTAA
ncbi:hypothetical protein E1295_11360 [Nonomuraea mesophila]|uniref:Uncharacterized protein n=1 Tax=Nonomuraea mesophila TaxID=2530382 RepID=A0A4R5FT39_9ACTN|nr:hypothetical protein [Nonomuraea mesophila]TDE56158.1 hypothetical protein E1295_11360 [Nonomuraea mesophila]